MLQLPDAQHQVEVNGGRTATGQSITAKADVDPVITADASLVRARDYLGHAGASDPAVSPVYGSLAGLPPLLIQAGSHEGI